jgi:hypothetical protein
VQINNVHAIIFVRRLSSGAILLTLVNAALQVKHHFILLESESLLFPDRGEHVLTISQLDDEAHECLDILED